MMLLVGWAFGQDNLEPNFVPGEPGKLTVTQDYEFQEPWVDLPFDGVFVAGDGREVTFESTVSYTDRGWKADVQLGFSGKEFLVTHERTDVTSNEPGVFRFVDLTPGTPIDPGYGLVLGDLAVELYERFPVNPRGEGAFDGDPLGRGVALDAIGVNKVLLRESARMVGRWTLVGMLGRDQDPFDRGLDDNGQPLDPPEHPHATPGPTPTPTTCKGPTDTHQPIDCEHRCVGDTQFNGESARHEAEHDFVTPALLPAGAHCNIVQNEVCGSTSVSFGGQTYHYCSGRCGFISTLSPFPGCVGFVHGRTSWQDCLDADACIVRHELGGSGVGTAGCANVEAQSIDDDVGAFAKDFAYYASKVLTAFPLSLILDDFVDLSYAVDECLLEDPLKNSNPVTSEVGASCSCPDKDGFGQAFCDTSNQCIYIPLNVGFCGHSPCTRGANAPLYEGCDTGIPGDPNSCVTQVCAIDPYCCNNRWDNSCRQEAIDTCMTCP